MTQAEIQTFPSTLFMGSTAPLPCLLALWRSLITLFAPPPWCALPHGHQAGQNGHEMGQLPAQIPAVPFSLHLSIPDRLCPSLVPSTQVHGGHQAQPP